MAEASDKDAKQKEDEMDIEALAKQYKTNLKKGLTGKKAAEILERDGLNELEKPPKPTLLMLFLMQLTSFIIILLMVAAVASILVNATGPRAADPLSYTTGSAFHRAMKRADQCLARHCHCRPSARALAEAPSLAFPTVCLLRHVFRKTWQQHGRS
ncbi:ATP1A1 [Symbiodinium necroappetens]|uniref:ATP1A1 protein n=1 Tax=Symbiodinium necroappetens TaxID=1628268 RepID=A0A812JHY8_9DINO|nr:ATP1A1 [Symbiodinium necroappetens]